MSDKNDGLNSSLLSTADSVKSMKKMLDRMGESLESKLPEAMTNDDAALARRLEQEMKDAALARALQQNVLILRTKVSSLACPPHDTRPLLQPLPLPLIRY